MTRSWLLLIQPLTPFIDRVPFWEVGNTGWWTEWVVTVAIALATLTTDTTRHYFAIFASFWPPPIRSLCWPALNEGSTLGQWVKWDCLYLFWDDCLSPVQLVVIRLLTSTSSALFTAHAYAVLLPHAKDWIVPVADFDFARHVTWLFRGLNKGS